MWSRRQTLGSLAFILAAVPALAVPALRPLQVSGGGWVMDIAIHPSDPKATYLRTDVGGAWRFDRATGQWVSLSEGTPPERGAGFHAVDALCFDPAPARSSHLWMTVGRGTEAALLRSTDYGDSWTAMHLPAGVGIDGNGRYPYDYRTTGPRLACDPHHEGPLLLGTRRDGLWRSTDRGRNWAPVAAPGGAGAFVVWVHYDRFRPGRALIAVDGVGLYVTDDIAAASPAWQQVVAGGHPRRVAQGPDGTIFCTYRPGVVDRDETPSNGVLYRVTFGPEGAITVADLTIPETGGYHKGLIAVAVDPGDPNFLFLSTAGPSGRTVVGGTVKDAFLLRSTDALAAAPAFEVLRRNDSGAGAGFTVRSAGLPGWLRADEVIAQFVTAFAFDPHLGHRVVWAVEAGGGVDRTDDVRAPLIEWRTVVQGLEETVTGVIASNPNGNIVSGMADIGGFFHDRGPDLSPTVRLYDAGTGRCGVADIDYSGGHPARMVYVGRETIDGGWHIGGYSDDHGVSWTRWSTAPLPFPAGTNPVMVAVSAGDPDNVVISGRLGIYSLDNGRTWHACAGLPDGEQGNYYGSNRTLAADKVLAATFYKLQANGDFYRSTDGGENWTAITGTGLPGGARPWDQGYPGMVTTAPNVGGHIWVTPGRTAAGTGNPPYFSTDRGDTWAPVPGFASAKCVALGKAPVAGHYAVYILGTRHGAYGLWASPDSGATFRDVLPAGKTLGNANTMEGDHSAWGRVFIGTSGSGMRYLTFPDDEAAGSAPTSTLRRPVATPAVADRTPVPARHGGTPRWRRPRGT